MAVQFKMAAILFFMFSIFASSVVGCDVDDVAVYKVSLQTMWTEERFPKDYPIQYRPRAQWSQVFGQSHNATHIMYRLGEVAKLTIRNFAQFGKIDDLVKEGEEDSNVYDQFSASAIGVGSGNTENMVFVDGQHSLVSLICRIIPSPDWFIGVDSLNLCVETSWVDRITLDLEPLDAGTASGLTFTAPRWETSPPETVTKHKPKQPDHPAAGFYYPGLKELPAIAKVEFTRIKQYSTKELNDLIRKDLIAKLKEKDRRKGMPRRRKIVKKDGPKNYDRDATTKSYIDHLKEIEEEPLGTPLPNLPDNKVDVITKPIITTTTEAEFDSEIRSMDDVILAVANGRKLGLRKHLPRHFRHRLHHAVNRIQPNDCIVSEWSEWSSCSVTCGFGDKFRHRSVVRQNKKGGRACPKLTDRKHCGNVNSCVQIDYFNW